jgi:hypothetical protein
MGRPGRSKSPPSPHPALEVELLEDLGLRSEPEPGPVKPLPGEDLAGENALEPDLGAPRQVEAEHEEVRRLPHAVDRVVEVIAPVERLDLLDEARLGVDLVHEEDVHPPDARPCQEARVHLEVSGDVLVADLGHPFPRLVHVVDAQGVVGVRRRVAAAPRPGAEEVER